jgi:hypothetical protein
VAGRVSHVTPQLNPAVNRRGEELGTLAPCRTGLDGDAAVRSREAARSAASALVHDEDDEPAAEDDEAPFRRQE